MIKNEEMDSLSSLSQEAGDTFVINPRNLLPQGLLTSKDTVSGATLSRQPGLDSDCLDAMLSPPRPVLKRTTPTAPKKNLATYPRVSVSPSTETDPMLKELDLEVERVQTLTALPNVSVMELQNPISRRITPRRILCTPVESVHLRNALFANAETSQLYIGIGDPLEPVRHDLRQRRAQMRTGSLPHTSGGMDTMEYPM
jgi:hypothetical protein